MSNHTFIRAVVASALVGSILGVPLGCVLVAVEAATRPPPRPRPTECVRVCDEASGCYRICGERFPAR